MEPAPYAARSDKTLGYVTVLGTGLIANQHKLDFQLISTEPASSARSN